METDRQPFGRGCPVITTGGTILTLTSGPSTGLAPQWIGLGTDGLSVTVLDRDIAGPVRNFRPHLVFSDDRSVANA